MKKRLSSKPMASRRRFLGGCAAMTAAPVLSSLTQLNLINSAYAMGGVENANDYRALVCVFLLGGNDSFNMLVPRDNNEYNRYAEARKELALPRNDLLPISANGRSFGVHPAMTDVQQLYNQGKLSFLANTGTLVRPTTIQDFQNGTALPRSLFSHNDQQQVWQTSLPESAADLTGWGARMTDIVNAANSNDAVSMNISLNSFNYFQNGRNSVPYIISPNGALPLNSYGGNSAYDSIFTGGTDNVLADHNQNLLKQSFTTNRRSAIDTAIVFQAATENISLSTAFPSTSLGSQLKMVARTISARQTLGKKRQTFFVSIGGFDTHNALLVTQNNLLKQVSEALKAFYDATVELGVSDKVTTFTASDFGRTLTSNGQGSDHAWGGNYMVMGDAVNGGQIFGDYPFDLVNPTDANGSSIDTGRGRLLPTTSVDEYNAELARWFGVPNDTGLADVLPNIRNFYPSFDTNMPIGFLNA